MNLILHGGLGPASLAGQPRLEERRRALRRIWEEGRAFLEGHSAVETVVHVVRLLEDDPLFNAGTGSKLQQDGRARLSAALMDGPRRRFSGVINVENVRHPIEIAHLLQEEPFRVLAAEGAGQFARSRGMAEYDPVTAERRAEWQRGVAGISGTVGACALDREGRLAAATSTGGRGGEWPGRVSDSATVAGNYATEEAAVSCTGVGEDIVDEALAVRLALLGPRLAGEMAGVMEAYRRTGRLFGAIALDARGVASVGWTEGTMMYCYRSGPDWVTG